MSPMLSKKWTMCWDGYRVTQKSWWAQSKLSGEVPFPNAVETKRKEQHVLVLHERRKSPLGYADTKAIDNGWAAQQIIFLLKVVGARRVEIRLGPPCDEWPPTIFRTARKT